VRTTKLIPACLLAILISATLSSGAEYQESVKVKKLLDTGKTNLGQDIHYPHTGSAQIQSLLVELAPGAETGAHEHPIITYGYMLAGAIEIKYKGSRKKTYKKGDAFIEAVNTWHNGKNIGKTPAKILVVFISEKNQKTVLRKK
jgi:quercetin dioxygenase-like cupin family protein